jgi:undecaprenyl-phosphate glucose phosphotransferase
MTDNIRRQGYGRYLQACFNFTDLVLVNLLFWITILICPEIKNSGDIRQLWLLVSVSYLPVIIWSVGDPHRWRAIVMDRVVRDSLITVGFHALFFLSLIAFLGLKGITLKGYLIFYALMTVCLPSWWLISRWFVKHRRRRGYNFTRVVIVGTNATSLRLMSELEVDPGYGYHIEGFFDDECEPDFRSKGKYLGTLDDLEKYVREKQIKQIYYTLMAPDGSSLARVIRIADSAMCEFFFVPRVPHFFGRSFELRTIGQMPVLANRRNPLKSRFNSAVKRTFDIVFSSVVLCFYPIVYIPVAIAIKLTSPGPVYFKQKRTGYRGESFECLKFRTMHVNSSADSVQATEHDPRKTRLGDFLRRTSIDELPQLINVFKGDMSIVGPRPHMLKHTRDYSKLIEQYMARHTVRPGITGWAQVNGYRGPTDELWKMEKRVEYDVWYIENWTLLLDLKIIVRTVINALHGEKNAY